MPKSKKKQKPSPSDTENPTNDKPASSSDTKPPATEKKPKDRPIIRAIRVTKEILDAAKEYKKAKGVSFYTLGFESISDRLVKEGFLKKANQ